MNKIAKKIFLFLLAIIISIWVINKSISLRKFGYENYPVPITDEFTYVWQGLSLKKTGLPMAWTLNSGIYKDKKFNPTIGNVKGFGIEIENKFIDLSQFKKNPKPLYAVKEVDYMKGKEHMLFVAPFFDHPPLGGLIYSLGVNKEVKEIEDIKPIAFRKPALILAILTTIFLFILLTLITSNPFAGVLGVIVYGTVSTYLLAARTAFLENVVPIFVLPSLIALFLYFKYSSKKFSIILLIISGLLSGLSVLAKEPAIGFTIGSLILLIQNKTKIKNIFIFLIFSSIPILFYLIWGLWLHSSLFIDIFLTNASRKYFGSIKIITMLEALKFKNFPTDGWWIWGILSFIFLSIKQKDKRIFFITIPLTTHLLVTLLLGGENYPWYWISSIPFFAACSALVIKEIFEKPNLIKSLLFFFIPFSSSYYWGREALNISPSINHYRIAFLIFMIMLFLRLKFKKNKIFKILWIVFISWIIYKIVIFNELFFPYMIFHWGNLSVPNLPNF